MYGRMIEIYLYTSVAPIPFATMSNREWGQIGTNYFRGLFALAFQAFNSDRRYYERVQETGTYLDTVAASTDQAELKTVQDFLDHIENQELYHVLITVDRLTLQIVLMKI